MKSNFLNSLLSIFEGTLEVRNLSIELDYKSHPSWSSLQALLLATSIEAEWGYLPTHEDFESTRTIGELSAHLFAKVQA